MARALECPACGHRHRLDSVPSADTFRCDNCGQVLKAPSTVASEPGAPPPPARTSRPTSTGAPAPVAPPPRRTTTAPPATAAAAAGATGADATAAASPTRTAPARNAAAVSATVAAVDGNGADAVDTGRGRRGARPTGVEPAPAPSRKRVHWYWRMLAWIVAVPLAFVVTAWPAYHFSFITKDDLLDIFVGNGIGRYVRLGIVTVVWALVTALLVQLFVEGGRARAARRRRTRAVAT